VTLDTRWAHLRDGDFVVIDKERDVMPIANDPGQERRLWDTTRALLSTKLYRLAGVGEVRRADPLLLAGSARYVRGPWPGGAS
jgi:hypothetical protein